MKRINKLIILLTCLTMLLTFTACKPEEGTSSVSSSEASSALSAPEFNFDTTTFQGKTLNIWAWWETPASEIESNVAFEEKTGAKIEYTIYSFGDYFTKCVAAITSGTGGPDLLWMHENGMPTWIFNGLIAPIKDYVNIEDSSIKEEYSKNLMKHFTYKDIPYSIAPLSDSNWLYYNKAMFKAASLADPIELFNKGEWTWDAMIKAGQELTADTDEDGTIDQFGYASWLFDQWFSTNSASKITWIDGKPTVTLDSPASLASLQAIKDVAAEGKYKISAPPGANTPDPQQQFLTGMVAMDYWGAWDYENFKEKLGDDLGFCPFPLGPDYTGTAKTADLANAASMAISSTSNNKELAGHYITYYLTPKQDDLDKLPLQIEEMGGQEIYDMRQMMKRNIVVDNTIGFGQTFTDIYNNNILYSVIWGATASPAELVAASKATLQAELDTFLNKYKDKID